VPGPLPVRLVYNPAFEVDLEASGLRHSFDPLKFRRIRDELVALGLARPEDFRVPETVSREDLLRVHSPEHLAWIEDRNNLALLLELRGTPPADLDLLQPFLQAAGGTLLACELALEGPAAAFNFGGGYHHAGRSRARGLCPVADTAVAVRRLKERGRVRRVLLLDLDFHHGNGPAVLFQEDPEVFTLSIHRTNWVYLFKPHNLDVEVEPGIPDADYLKLVDSTLMEVRERFRPDLILYTAGQDVWKGDRYGGLGLSEETVLARDLLVLGLAERGRTPLAVVAGGGFGPDSWRIYHNFVRAALERAARPA